MPMPIRPLEHGNPLLLPGEHAYQRNEYLVVQRHEQYRRHRHQALEHRRRNHEGAADLVVHQYALLGEERHWLLKNDGEDQKCCPDRQKPQDGLGDTNIRCSVMAIFSLLISKPKFERFLLQPVFQ
jgi:hypothetical protein